MSFEALGILNQIGVPRPLPKHSPLPRFPHSSAKENASGCQSVCAQTTLPPGPLLGHIGKMHA